jgi:hypothetical protein
MPWSMNDASRQAAQQRLQQQQQQQIQRFHRHNQQFAAKQMNDMMARMRAGGRARPSVGSGFPGDEDDQQPGRARRPGRIVWVLLVVLGLVIGGAALSSNSREVGFMPGGSSGVDRFMPGGSSGVDGIVREGTAWNVRGGPGMAFPPIAVVHPGEAVVVTCLERGWAQLESPNAGAFVYAKGLALNGTPPPC